MKYTRFERHALGHTVMHIQAETVTSNSYEKKRLLFQEGCRVALRSAPTFTMTLDHFVKTDDELAAECVWLDTSHRLCREIFNLTSLCVVADDVIEVDYEKH